MATRVTQVNRALDALLEGWLSPQQLTAVSGRVNPNGLIRDTRPEAARRGLIWREIWVRNERGRRFKMHHIEDPTNPRQHVDNVGDGRKASRDVQAPPARRRPRRPCLSGGALAGRREEQGRLDWKE